MGIAGYVSIYVLLYCMLFFSLGHLQVCKCLVMFKESASLLFGYVVALCMFTICGMGKVVI
jgi:hypothetical protein